MTSLVGGSRVDKDHGRVEAYGMVDELNSWIGLAVSESDVVDVEETLRAVQSDLFHLGSELATPYLKENSSRISAEMVTRLETQIDRYSESLPALRNFVLPGGTKVAATLHLARTCCRRVERQIVQLARTEAVDNQVFIYLNRLSDLLFTLARYQNHHAGVSDVEWKSSR